MSDFKSFDAPEAGFGTPYRAVLDHCRIREIQHQAFPAEKAVRYNLRGETAIYTCTLRITHADEVLQIRLDYPVLADKVPTPAQTAEFVARANYGLIIGRFDLDVDSGALAFHVGHVIGAGGLAEESINDLMISAVATAERYFPGLMRMAFGGHTPSDAIYLCELDTQAEASEPERPPASPPPGKSAKRKPRSRTKKPPPPGA